MQRIGIIGVGQIGGALTQMILQHHIQVHIGLYDVNQELLQGKVWDLEEASIIGGYEASLEIISSLDAFSCYDVLVITAGRSRSPGMHRKDLLVENSRILKTIAQATQDFKGVIVVVTNPVDLMTRFFFHLHSLPPYRVMGMAGILDESRMAYHIKALTGLKAQGLRPCVVGPHSDHMVPLEAVGLGPGSLQNYLSLSSEQKAFIVHNTRRGGERIVEKLKSGSAFYGPAAACFRMIQNILEMRQEVLTCSVHLGTQKVSQDLNQDVNPDIFFGWPVLLGKEGIKTKVTPCINSQEKDMLHASLIELQHQYEDFFRHSA